MTSAQEVFNGIVKTYPPETSVLIINQSLDGALNIDLTNLGLPLLHTIRFETPGNITRLTINDPQQKLRNLSVPNQELTMFDSTLSALETLDMTNNQLVDIKITNKLPNLRVLRLGNNKLTQFHELPAQLEELWLNDNQLDALDLGTMKQLRELHVAKNSSSFYLLNVPGSIKTMTSDAAGQTTYSDRPVKEYTHNYSPSIGSSEASSEAISEASTEASTDQNKKQTGPGIASVVPEIVAAEMRADYDRALRKYFELKHKYEDQNNQAKTRLLQSAKSKKKERETVRAFVPKCIKCKRPGGTVFRRSVEDGKYTHEMFCGNTSQPCVLKVVLQRSYVSNFEYYMDTMTEMLEDKKGDIIQHKLDTLFQYISESQSVEKFKVLLDEYNVHAKDHQTLTDIYTDLHFSEHTAELVREKLTSIYGLKLAMRDMTEEYKNTGNKTVLQSVAKMYVSDYLPEIDALRRLNYEVMEMNDITPFATQSKYADPDKRKGEHPVQQFQLFQMDVAFKKREDMYSSLSEKVVAFNV